MTKWLLLLSLLSSQTVLAEEAFPGRISSQEPPSWVASPPGDSAVGMSELTGIERSQRQAYFKALAELVRLCTNRSKAASDQMKTAASPAVAGLAKLQLSITTVDWWKEPGSSIVHALAKVSPGWCERALKRGTEEPSVGCGEGQRTSGSQRGQVRTTGWGVVMGSSGTDSKAKGKLRALTYALQQLDGSAGGLYCKTLATNYLATNSETSESESLSRLVLYCSHSLTLESGIALDWQYKTLEQHSITPGNEKREVTYDDLINVRFSQGEVPFEVKLHNSQLTVGVQQNVADVLKRLLEVLEKSGIGCSVQCAPLVGVSGKICVAELQTKVPWSDIVRCPK